MTTTETGPATVADLAAAPGRIMAAWAAHDADAFAAAFTEDAFMVLPGASVVGREEIRDFMAQAFAGPYRGTQVTGTPAEARFTSQSSAVVLTTGGVIAAGADEVDPTAAVHGLWVLVQRDDEWAIAAYQNTPIAG